MQRPSLITRLLRFAPVETAMAVLNGSIAVYGIRGYQEFIKSDLPYSPLIFAFGQWPFYVVLLIAVGCAFAAFVKADRA